MKYSHRLSDAVHILTYLEIYHGQKISSQDLAASVDANPSLIRSLIAKMVKAGTTRASRRRSMGLVPDSLAGSKKTLKIKKLQISMPSSKTESAATVTFAQTG